MATAKKVPNRAKTERVITDKTGATWRMLIAVEGVTINRKPLPAAVAVKMIADSIEEMVSGLVVADIKRQRGKKK